ncbi:ATP-binding protein [Microbispora amethystogenes]|uniref:ATP-binding protein n=1 Tax=Microbispora amethystogenes TaxID=1427754 RepID=UPI003409B71C
MSTPDMSEWWEERRRQRLEAFRNRRPVELRHKGDLHDEIADWGSRLFDHTARNLIVIGHVGTGKTWAVWEVLERAVAASYQGHIVFLTAAEWQEIVGPPVDRERLRQMREADVLVLDDLGSTRINDWTRDVLGPIVDWRWQNGQPIVITSNMKDLEPAVGPRMDSRLTDRATVVAINGEDRRAR